MGRTASTKHLAPELGFPFIFFVNALDGIDFSFVSLRCTLPFPAPVHKRHSTFVL